MTEWGPGTEFAGYRIERRLGAGGMGEVYLVSHPRLPRRDALKVLSPQYSADPQYRARFIREAELAAGLSHPAIVKVHDRGETDGRLWIAMEFVDGVDLAERVRSEGPLPGARVAEVVSVVADALDRAHARGLVHRDVKPANILLSSDGDVLLTDFGIARSAVGSSDLTATGMAIGTLAYASPEQLQGLPVDGRSDQYSLACTTFQLLTGAAPFADTNAAMMITKHLTEPLPSLSSRRAGLPAQVDEVLARATAKDPAQRYRSSTEFARALSAALTVPPPSAEPPPIVHAVVEPAVADPGAGDDTPTQLVPGPRRSRRTAALVAGAVVAVIAVVAGVLFVPALLPADLTIVAGASRGGDGWARGLERALEDNDLAERVKVTNIAGVPGGTGLAEIAGKRGDASTLLLAGTELLRAVAEDPTVTGDAMTPIARLAEDHFVVVVRRSAFADIGQLMQKWRAEPGGLSFVGVSSGGVEQLIAAQLARASGVTATERRYQAFYDPDEIFGLWNNPQFSSDRAVAIISAGSPALRDQIRDGNASALMAVAPRRLAGFEDVPTAAEAGLPEVDLVDWLGVVAPPGLPGAEQDRLIATMQEMAKTRQWQDTLAQNGWAPAVLTGAGFRAFLAGEQQRITGLLAGLGPS